MLGTLQKGPMPTSAFKSESESTDLTATPADRFDRGRSRRDAVPLESHLEIAAESGRVDPRTILAKQDDLRLSDLVPLRYGRMSRTPFTFLRGAAAIMASDLAACARTDLSVELCGDAHLGNFRWYRAPNRDLVFDLNDFDETLPGPFEWDLKRLAASITVCARTSGLSKEQARNAVRSALRAYRASMTETSELNPFDLHYYRFESQDALKRLEKHGKGHRKWKQAILTKAARRNSLLAFDKLTTVVDGRRMIVSDPPLIDRVDAAISSAGSTGVSVFLDDYRQSLSLEHRVFFNRFTLVDVARKVVGVGSVGTRCLIALFEAGDGTPLFLQLKQATPSVLEAHLGASPFTHAGQRVVEGQRLIQATSDVLLGWARWKESGDRGVDYYCRQLWDGKGKIDVEVLGPNRLAAYAGLCGKTLAFAHARSGDAMMIRGYIGDDNAFDDIIVEYADRYADLNERDHAQLCAAINDGAIEAVRDI
jgi:uncharacterized protein (DUF2252 family)